MDPLERAAARLLTVGFRGRAVDPEIASLLERGVGGVILFTRNLGTPIEVAELVRSLKAHADGPLFAAVDQEGGRVARLREGFTRVPPMRAIGRTNDPELARAVGRVLGSELKAVGIDVDFAPVLDVDTNPQNPVIGDRSFASDPETVARLGLALAGGLFEEGVAACGKHFPGHGDTTQDSHLELPRLAHDRERLGRIELAPFRAAVRADLPALMTAHVVVEAFDAELPATMSGKVVGELLRGELGYAGVVFTDDLEMKAIADHFTPERVARSVLEAGVDALLCCHSAALAHRLIDALVACAKAESRLSERLFESSARLEAFQARFAAPPRATPDLTRLDCAEHREVVAALGSG